MSRNLYIASVEPRSGKSVVALGVMETLARNAGRVGFFRPLVRSREAGDGHIQLLAARYGIAEPPHRMSAVTFNEAEDEIAAGRQDEVIKRVLSAYKAIEGEYDFMLIEGTDYTDAPTIEFTFNAECANNLRAPVLLLASASGKSLADMLDVTRVAHEAFRSRGCRILGVVVNRAPRDQLAEYRDAVRAVLPDDELVYALPEEPLLGKPTITEIATALKAELLYGKPEDLDREVLDVRVAAMGLPHYLDRMVEGSLVIVPGDRADIIVGCLLTQMSETYPHVAGLLLNGGIRPQPSIMKLLAGLKQTLAPILAVDTDTFTTAMRVHHVPAVIAPTSRRKIELALATFEAHVDGNELAARLHASKTGVVTPIMFEYELIQRAKSDRKRIVLPEGEDERILRAAEILKLRDVCDLTLLGNDDEIRAKISSLGLKLDGVSIINPASSPWREAFARAYYELRKHKGMTEEAAFDLVADVSYFGTLMVHFNYVDGMVSGACHTTQHTIRPGFEIIRTKPGFSVVSSVFLMCLRDRVLVYGDCAVNPNPTAEQLAEIALASADTAATFGVEPRVAMLSYSTGESGKGEDVEKVREATRLVRERRPELKVEGPIQYDAAVDAGVAKTKLPNSEVAGRATVFIFPDLNTGNNTYKAVQRSAEAVAIGPVLQGLKKPVNDLSRGCTVTDVVNTIAITAVQAQASGSAPPAAHPTLAVKAGDAR